MRHKAQMPDRNHGSGGLLWHVTVLSKIGLDLLDHAALDNREYVKAYCTERRSENLSTKIIIRPPAGECYEWA